jgi:ribulose bisphosphate carboxylase small subunit
MKERRIEPRLLCADLVEVEWTGPNGRRRRDVANLEDISATGVCLQMEIALPLNSAVSLRLPEDDVKGDVRYCVHREIGYYVGVEFEEGTRWSARMFKPQHLLDPAKLAPQKSAARAATRAKSA